MSDNAMRDTMAEWRTARDIIARFMCELRNRPATNVVPAPFDEHNAAAIIARLAQNKPPLIISFAEED